MDKWCYRHKVEKKHVSLDVWVCIRCIKDRVRELERKNRKKKEDEKLEQQRDWDLHLFQMH